MRTDMYPDMSTNMSPNSHIANSPFTGLTAKGLLLSLLLLLSEAPGSC